MINYHSFSIAKEIEKTEAWKEIGQIQSIFRYTSIPSCPTWSVELLQ